MTHARYTGRHRTARFTHTARLVGGGVLLAGTAAATIGVGSGVAGAAPATHNWDGVANCESSGNWGISTGNGFSGGLQFTQSTWNAYGGQAYAGSASQASKSAQIAVAERVLAGQGVGAWPVCGKYLSGGTSSGASSSSSSYSSSSSSSSSYSNHSSSQQSTSRSYSTPTHSSSSTSSSQRQYAAPTNLPAVTGKYTVKSGDTLSQIAATYKVQGGWQSLAGLNRATIADPNLIFPGQVIAL